MSKIRSESDFWLAEYRRESGYTQQDIADALGKQLVTIQKWEIKRNVPLTVETIETLARLFNIPTLEILVRCGFDPDLMIDIIRLDKYTLRIISTMKQYDDASKELLYNLFVSTSELVSSGIQKADED